MSFEHAERMHKELSDQGMADGDCFAASLDSILVNQDLPDGFYYDISKAQREQNYDRFEQLVRQQLTAHFRQDHPTFEVITSLFTYSAPDGNPNHWGAPADPYEVAPKELSSWIEERAAHEWERVYGLHFEDETNSERKQRANAARDDAYERLGIFIVVRNMILDGTSFMPVHSVIGEDATHVFAVHHTGLDDIHVINKVVPEDSEETTYQPLERSPHLDLAWLCSLDEGQEDSASPKYENMFGLPYTRITDSNVPIDEQGTVWKYALYAVPPQK